MPDRDPRVERTPAKANHVDSADSTLADRDQTSSDADQTWADHDQDASDRDQAAAHDDQRASDEGVVAGGDPSVRARTTSVRARTSADRHLVSRLRDESGSERLLTAEERDRLADRRDRAATEDDQAALALLGATADEPYRSFSALIERASEARKRAGADRARAAADRARAAADRARASDEREQAAQDRLAVIRRLNEVRAELAIAPADVLLQAVTERDVELGFHVSAVVQLARATAAQLGANGEDLETTRQTALLHDVGKVAIPDEILNKPGSLDPSEWAFVRQHTLIGERIIQAAPALAHVAKLVRSTHERYDGSGYPDGLARDGIPLIARTVSVCDAYDAMITTRAYRTARTSSDAVAELRSHSGTQFDPEVVDAFVNTLEAFGIE